MSAPRPDTPAWPGLRRLAVLRRVPECRDVVSLVLGADDGARLPPFRPGQFATFALELPGAPRRPSPFLAVYSLSGKPADGTWRITVKDLAPAGPPDARGSSWLARGVQVGDVLQARAPAGHFGVPVEATAGGEGPIVMVAGGIGITPFVPMLHAAAASRAPRPITVLLGMRSAAEHPLRAEVAAVTRATRGARLVTTYSQPGPDDLRPGAPSGGSEGRAPTARGVDGARAGRVSASLLQEVLPPADDPYTFLLCGPPAMLIEVQSGLRGLGVPDSAVKVEVFGPAAVRATSRLRPAASGVAGVKVEFARAGKTVAWDPKSDALFYLAEQHGVPIPHACLAGRCGACLTPLRSGTVTYKASPEAPALRPGSCLPCVAVPTSDVVLDA